MLGLLETGDAQGCWELMYRREMSLRKIATRKRLFDKVRLTPTADQITIVEGFSFQAYQFNFSDWPVVSDAKRKAVKQKPRGNASADSRKSKRRAQLQANTQDIRRASGKNRPADWQSGESWKRQQQKAKQDELRQTVRPLPKQAAGPCGPAPEDGECRRLTIWDNSQELEDFCEFGDFSRQGRLGFLAGVIFKCGTFVVITDVTARWKHDPRNPKLELKYGYAKYNSERACKGTDPEFPWDDPPTNRAELSALISRYPHRARAASYDIHHKFFTSEDDAESSSNPAPTTPTRDTNGPGDQPAAPPRQSLVDPTTMWVKISRK